MWLLSIVCLHVRWLTTRFNTFSVKPRCFLCNYPSSTAGKLILLDTRALVVMIFPKPRPSIRKANTTIFKIVFLFQSSQWCRSNPVHAQSSLTFHTLLHTDAFWRLCIWGLSNEIVAMLSTLLSFMVIFPLFSRMSARCRFIVYERVIGIAFVTMFSTQFN